MGATDRSAFRLAAHALQLIHPAVNFAAFGPANDGSADVGPKLKAAIASAAASNIKRVFVPRGRYRIDITGDADTIVFPDYLYLDCDEGVTFVWNYWGSPLFAMVNKTSVGVIGANFEWGGTFGTTTGSRDPFGYGVGIPSYEWCCHIAAPGSDNVRLEDLSCNGTTTANRLNSLGLIKPKSDFVTPVKRLRIKNVLCNDVSQGFLAGGMTDFRIEDVRCERYANDSAGLYGPGHLIYFIENGVPTSHGVVKNIRDYATTQHSSYVTGSHTLSVKNVQNTAFEDIWSARPEGALNMWKTRRNSYQVTSCPTDTTTDLTSGLIYFPGTTSNFNDDNQFDCNLTLAAGRDMAAVNQSGVVFGGQIPRMRGAIRVSHAPVSNQTSQVNYLTCSDSQLTIEITTTVTGAKKADIQFFDEATVRRNSIDLKVIGPDAATSSPRVIFGASAVNNRVRFHPCSLFDYDRNSDFTDANNNVVAIAADSELISSKSAASGQSPSFTVQLPRKGSYLLDVAVLSSDGNHGLSGLYRVEWDGGFTNNYSTAQLIGATAAKGTNVTGLTVTVSTAGLVTVATTTTTTDTFNMRVGYRRTMGL